MVLIRYDIGYMYDEDAKIEHSLGGALATPLAPKLSSSHGQR